MDPCIVGRRPCYVREWQNGQELGNGAHAQRLKAYDASWHSLQTTTKAGLLLPHTEQGHAPAHFFMIMGCCARIRLGQVQLPCTHPAAQRSVSNCPSKAMGLQQMT